MSASKEAAVQMIVGGIRLYVYGFEKAGKTDPASLETRENLSVVFVAHGRLGTSDKMRAICQELVKKPSLIAVAFDQRNHGDRLLEVGRNGAWENPTHVNDMFSIQFGTSKDISYLIDVFPAFFGFSPRSYGVVGVSLGGHVTLLSMASDHRIAFGVSIIGCGNYEALMTHRATANSNPGEDLGKDPTLGGRMNLHLKELLKRVDPVHRYLEFKDRPILLLSGQEDPLVPAQCNREFLERLRSVFEHQERLKEVIYPGVAHQLAPAMIPETANWCEKWCGVSSQEHSQL